MSEFSRDDYINLYTPQLVELLDLAEELPLFQTPDVLLEITGKTVQQAVVFGKEVNADDMNTVEGIVANTEITEGKMALQGFAAQCTITLFADALERRQEDYAHMSEAQKEQYVDVAQELIEWHVKNARSTYVKTGFRDQPPREGINVHMLTLEGVGGSFSARELKLNIEDEAVKRTFFVQQRGWRAFAEAPQLSIKQSITPREDPELHAMAEFFSQKEDFDSHWLLVTGFTRRLEGEEPSEFDEVRAKYPGPDEAKVREFIALMERRAEAAIADSRLLQENPGLALLSAAELDEYREILLQARG